MSPTERTPPEISTSLDVPLKTRREALEEIRTADRIVGGAAGTFQRLQRDQVLDFVGFESDGVHGEFDRGDYHRAAMQLDEAEHAFNRGLALLGVGRTHASHDLAPWGLTEGLIGGVFDLIAMARARKAKLQAQALHEHFKTVFDLIRDSDPALEDVEPLGDWTMTNQEYLEGWRYVDWKPIIMALLGIAAVRLLFHLAGR